MLLSVDVCFDVFPYDQMFNQSTIMAFIGILLL